MEKTILPWTGSEIRPEDIHRAFNGPLAAKRNLAAALWAVVERVVRHVLRPIAGALRRDIGQEVEEFVQETWILLLKEQGQILRLWDPTRGRNLSSWIYLVTRRHILRRLKSRHRNPWADREDLVALIDDDIPLQQTQVPDMERILYLEALLDALRENLGEARWRIFRQIFIEQRAPADIAADEHMDVSQIYDLSSYFRRQARALAVTLDGSQPPGTPGRVRTTLCTNP